MEAIFFALPSPKGETPLHKGGKEEGALTEIAQRIRRERKRGAIPTLRRASLALPESRKAI
jgi:hypothetical protein